MESVWIALKELCTVNVVLLALAGSVLGMIWGAMPGVSTVMAMALLVGVTAKLSTHEAIMILLTIMVSSVYGGSITAVLINMPGKATAIPTAIEGYPLTLKGEGGLALGTTIMGSFIGNWIGIIAVILCVPLILAIAMKFGSWEIFLLAFWGIAICGTLVGSEKPIKGWISGWLGLLIATVGIEPIHGVARFTFDMPALIDGIGDVPVIIGLFGLAEVLKALSSPSVKIEIKQVNRIIPKFSMLKEQFGTIVRSGFIGLIIGALPAAGPNIASFLSYITAKQRAKGEERAKFGKGSYTGLMAAEVADNACIGGDLLPTITLGIPGSAAMAIILGSLNLHGIRVGPALETHHPGLIYFFYACLILANFLMYGVALIIIKPGVKLFTMKKEILMPLIAPLCAIGAFGINQSPFDLYVMLATGLMGFALYRMRYPIAPMILGVILGPMADENLRKAIMIFQGQGATLLDILMRPVGTIMLVIIVLTFIQGLRKK
ncbi:MAG: tripartite tricarboxylate transporter permease [Syntrophales bacterium]